MSAVVDGHSPPLQPNERTTCRPSAWRNRSLPPCFPGGDSAPRAFPTSVLQRVFGRDTSPRCPLPVQGRNERALLAAEELSFCNRSRFRTVNFDHYFFVANDWVL